MPSFRQLERKQYILAIAGVLLLVVGLAYIDFHLDLLWPTGNLMFRIDDRPYWPLRSLIFEAGLVAIALAYVFGSKSSFSRTGNSRTILLPVILIVAFSFRSLWGYALPFFYGYDTANYIGVAHFLSDRFAQSVSILFLHTKNIPQNAFAEGIPSPEPLPYLLFAGLVHVGVPDAVIPRIIIPMFSAATILPFYLIVRDLYGNDAGLIAALVLAMGPMQFEFMAGLYRNLIGNFFMLSAFYLIIHEPVKRKWGAVLPIALLFLTYVVNVLIVLLTMFVYGVVCRKRAVFSHTLRVVAVSAMVSFFPLWVFGSLFTWSIINGALSLSPLTPGRLFFNLPFILGFLVPGLIFAVPALVAKSRSDFVFCLLSAVVLLFIVLGVTGSGFFEPERLLQYLEFPIIMLASKWICTTRKAFSLGTILAGWTFWQSMWLVSLPFLYGPSPAWSYYEKIIPAMPAVALTPDIFGWGVSSFVFTGVVLAAFALWRDFFADAVALHPN